MQVNFFVAGVQKAGTTALFHMLRQHAGVLIPPCKELHFFDNEETVWCRPDYSTLIDKFVGPAGSDLLLGDATPIYLYWPQALERIHRYNPTAKIIIALRHPTFRAFAQWKMEVSRGAEHLSFEEATSDRGRSRVRTAPNGVHRVFSYVERGFYADQLRRLFNIFPRDQVLCLRTDELWCNPMSVLTKIYEFLGIDNTFTPKAIYTSPYESRVIERLNTGIRKVLDKVYEKQIAESDIMTGLDLSDWLTPTYVEPMPTSLKKITEGFSR